MMMSDIDGDTSSSASVGNCRRTASFSDKSEAASLIRRRRTEVRRTKSLYQQKSFTVTNDDCFSLKRRLEKQNNMMMTLAAAAADKATGEVERENFSYQSISVIGRRREMEDAVSVEVGFVKETSKKYDFYGVYDGHGGSRVAYACRDRLHKLLAKEMVETSEEMDWEQMMLECFGKMDVEVTQTEDVGSIGSTAVVAVVGDREVVVGNCGDSRAVLSCGGATMPLSNDHKPDRPDELARIEDSGGRVLNWNGQRVLGVLATSRSIGDQQLKPYVIAKPEVRVHKRSNEDEFLILASDGLWDVISNDLACHVVRKCLDGRIFRRRSQGVNREEGIRRTVDAAAVLTELAMARGSKDNISVIVINLKSI